jgi:hypothetical protein
MVLAEPLLPCSYCGDETGSRFVQVPVALCATSSLLHRRKCYLRFGTACNCRREVALGPHHALTAERPQPIGRGMLIVWSERFSTARGFSRRRTGGYREGVPVQSRQTTTASSLSS